ncbi:TRAP transporter large permease [Palleronia abyssalis]|uniref:TRAP transporter large permease protein n=1 Tax=Palleronia abyssalis TaxID=1501240 RepID=A0A2R8BWP1_9RHOB|nr:TRAP transporter large permease subunit [Palleronia abyssalis]SPJ24574.1 C4-dicarboxylate TRAP transporter large permease protein DctM [Palleronia abyssalis]
MGAILLTIICILGVGLGIGLYVSVTIGFTALGVGLIFSDRPVWDALSYLPYNAVTTVTLLALPLFILMGELLLRSGITERMYDTVSKWLNWLPGGLLHTNIVASGLFACVSGSSPATAATIGGVAIPYMSKRGYDQRMMLGSIAGGGTLGILIPPSIVMIVYAVLAGESIGQLYIAGVVPGLILLGLCLGVILIAARVRPALAPKEASTSWAEKLAGLVWLLPILGLIVAVLGSIYAGVATPTEAAAFGVTGALIIAAMTGRLSLSMLRETLLATAATTSMIMLILVGAFLLQFVMAFLGLPVAMARAIAAWDLSTLQIVLACCVIYLVLGMFMESLSMIVITIPVLIPVLDSAGVDLLWFGIVVVMLVEASMITPPVGLNLFIILGLARRNELNDVGFKDVFLGVLPFFGALIVTLILVLIFPDLVFLLVRQM